MLLWYHILTHPQMLMSAAQMLAFVSTIASTLMAPMSASVHQGTNWHQTIAHASVRNTF